MNICGHCAFSIGLGERFMSHNATIVFDHTNPCVFKEVIECDICHGKSRGKLICRLLDAEIEPLVEAIYQAGL